MKNLSKTKTITPDGFYAAYGDKVNDLFTPEHAIAEVIDDAGDANAKNVKVLYSPQNDHLHVEDDGNGFEMEDFVKFFETVKAHMPKGKHDSSLNGYGLKDSILYYCYQKENAVVKIVNYRGNQAQIAEWKPFSKDGSKVKIKTVESHNGKHGITLDIYNSIKISIKTWGRIVAYISRHCSLKIEDGLNVMAFYGEFSENSFKGCNFIKLAPNDPLSLRQIKNHLNGNLEFEPGYYLHDDSTVHISSFIEATSEKTGEKVKVNVVKRYIPLEKLDSTWTTKDGGVYVAFNLKRYINMGDNISRMFDRSNLIRGDKSRQFFININSEELGRLFEIGASKGRGITNLCENQKLKEYKTKDGKDIYEAIVVCFNETEKLYNEYNLIRSENPSVNFKTIDDETRKGYLKVALDRLKTGTLQYNKRAYSKKKKKVPIEQLCKIHQTFNDNFNPATSIYPNYSKDALTIDIEQWKQNSIIILVKNKWCPLFVNLEEYQKHADFQYENRKAKPEDILNYCNEKILSENEKLMVQYKAA